MNISEMRKKSGQWCTWSLKRDACFTPVSSEASRRIWERRRWTEAWKWEALCVGKADAERGPFQKDRSFQSNQPCTFRDLSD